MSNAINEIVDVQITIENPAVNTSSFQKMLMIVPPPVTRGQLTMTGLTPITYIEDIVDYGYNIIDPTSADYCVYEAVSIALAQSPAPEMIYLIQRQVTTVEETTTQEAINETLDRANSFGDWYGYVIVGTASVADLTAAAAWADTNTKLFGFVWTGNALPITISENEHVFALYAGDLDTDVANATSPYGAVALMAKCFGYRPGAETWALKKLTKITPSALTRTTLNMLKNAHSNYYQTIADSACTNPGVVGTGEFIDNIRFRDWLTNEVQRRVYNFMIANSKVPYNDAGIAGIQNVIEAVLAEGQSNGGIDDDVYDGDTITKAYTVTVPLVSTIDKAVRQSRKLSNIIFVARLRGAIHKAVIRGRLVY